MPNIEQNLDAKERMELLRKQGHSASIPQTGAKFNNTDTSLFTNKSSFGTLTKTGGATGLEASLRTSATPSSTGAKELKTPQDENSIFGGTNLKGADNASVFTAQAPKAKSTDDVLNENDWGGVGLSFSGSNNVQPQENQDTSVIGKVKNFFAGITESDAAKRAQANQEASGEEKQSINSRKAAAQNKLAEKSISDGKRLNAEGKRKLESSEMDLASSEMETAQNKSSTEAVGSSAQVKLGQVNNNSQAQDIKNGGLNSKLSNAKNEMAKNVAVKPQNNVAASGAKKAVTGQASISVNTSNEQVDTSTKGQDVSSIASEAIQISEEKGKNSSGVKASFDNMSTAQLTAKDNVEKAGNNKRSSEEAGSNITTNTTTINNLNTNADKQNVVAETKGVTAKAAKQASLSYKAKSNNEKSQAAKEQNTANQLGQTAASAFAGAGVARATEGAYNAMVGTEKVQETKNMTSAATNDAQAVQHSTSSAAHKSQEGFLTTMCNSLKAYIASLKASNVSGQNTPEIGRATVQEQQGEVNARNEGIQSEKDQKLAEEKKKLAAMDKEAADKNKVNEKTFAEKAKEFGKESVKLTTVGTASAAGQQAFTQLSNKDKEAAKVSGAKSAHAKAQASDSMAAQMNALKKSMNLSSQAKGLESSTKTDVAKIERNNQENAQIARVSKAREQEVIDSAQELLESVKNDDDNNNSDNFSLDNNDEKDNSVAMNASQGANGTAKAGNVNGAGGVQLNKNNKNNKLQKNQKLDKKDENKKDEEVKEEEKTDEMQENQENQKSQDTQKQETQENNNHSIAGANIDTTTTPSVAETNIKKLEL